MLHDIEYGILAVASDLLVPSEKLVI